MKKIISILVCAAAVAVLVSPSAALADWDDHQEENGYLGVQTQSMTTELREHFGVPEDAGVLISRVEEGSPADLAGLRAGDIVFRVEGWKIDSPRELRREIRGHDAGDDVELEIYRDNDARLVVATLDSAAETWSHSFDCENDAHCFHDVHRHVQEAFHSVDWDEMMDHVEVTLESVPWESLSEVVNDSVANALEAVGDLDIELDLSHMERDLEEVEERMEERMERLERQLERLDRVLDEDD